MEIIRTETAEEKVWRRLKRTPYEDLRRPNDYSSIVIFVCYLRTNNWTMEEWLEHGNST